MSGANRQDESRVSPATSSDPARHRQTELFETENRPPTDPAPGDQATEPVGKSAGPDTSGAVARPAAAEQPGLSSALGGTPGSAARGDGRGTA